MKGIKKKKIWIAGTAVVFVCIAGVTGIYLYWNRESEPSMPQLPEGMQLSENVITASGLTSAGMEEESWELGFLEDGLYVEETYLNLGDEVEAGTPVFKVSEDSLESARRELEKAVTETSLNRREGEITYQTGVIDAQKERDLAAAEAAYAQAVYDNAQKEAQDSLDDIQKQVDEAAKKVEEYTASIEEDYYYTYYKVGELEATWKENAALLMELYETWDVDSLEGVFGGSGGKNGVGYVTNQVTQSLGTSAGSASPGGEESSPDAAPAAGELPEGSGEYFSSESIQTVTAQNASEENSSEENSSEENSSEEESSSQEEPPSFGGDFPGGGFSGGGMVSGNDIGGGMSVNVGDDEIRYNIWLALEEETQESESAYETALESYEEAKKQAEAGIAEAQSELAVLQAQLEEEKIAYEQAMITARQEYDTAVANQESAQTIYETTVKQLEEDLTALQEEEETAAGNLELFEEVIGDGTFYTNASGTVMMNSVRQDTWLTQDSMVVAFSNPDHVSVAASISQEDIASVSIGENVWVVVSEYGTFTGKVISFDPVSSSDSNTSVSYTVNVELDGETQSLESNLTAYVYFGLTEEEQSLLEQSVSGQETSGEDETQEGMEMPEGMQMPGGEDGQAPGNFGEGGGGQ